MLELEGHNLIRADHPSNIKEVGTYIYYKESLPVRIIKLPYFKKTLLLGIGYINQKVIVSVIYRYPGQNNDNFCLFISNFQHLISDINKRKPSLYVITGHFNVRYSSWWSNGIGTTEGLKLYTLTSTNGFDQLINEPTYIQTKSSSCIGLIFTDQPKSISKFWSTCIFTSKLLSSSGTL